MFLLDSFFGSFLLGSFFPSFLPTVLIRGTLSLGSCFFLGLSSMMSSSSIVASLSCPIPFFLGGGFTSSSLDYSSLSSYSVSCLGGCLAGGCLAGGCLGELILSVCIYWLVFFFSSFRGVSSFLGDFSYKVWHYWSILGADFLILGSETSELVSFLATFLLFYRSSLAAVLLSLVALGYLVLSGYFSMGISLDSPSSSDFSWVGFDDLIYCFSFPGTLPIPNWIDLGFSSAGSRLQSYLAFSGLSTVRWQSCFFTGLQFLMFSRAGRYSEGLSVMEETVGVGSFWEGRRAAGVTDLGTTSCWVGTLLQGSTLMGANFSGLIVSLTSVRYFSGLSGMPHSVAVRLGMSTDLPVLQLRLSSYSVGGTYSCCRVGCARVNSQPTSDSVLSGLPILLNLSLFWGISVREEDSGRWEQKLRMGVGVGLMVIGWILMGGGCFERVRWDGYSSGSQRALLQRRGGSWYLWWGCWGVGRGRWQLPSRQGWLLVGCGQWGRRWGAGWQWGWGLTCARISIIALRVRSRRQAWWMLIPNSFLTGSTWLSSPATFWLCVYSQWQSRKGSQPGSNRICWATQLRFSSSFSPSNSWSHSQRMGSCASLSVLPGLYLSRMLRMSSAVLKLTDRSCSNSAQTFASWGADAFSDSLSCVLTVLLSLLSRCSWWWWELSCSVLVSSRCTSSSSWGDCSWPRQSITKFWQEAGTWNLVQVSNSRIWSSTVARREAGGDSSDILSNRNNTIIKGTTKQTLSLSLLYTLATGAGNQLQPAAADNVSRLWVVAAWSLLVLCLTSSMFFPQPSLSAPKK